MTLNILYAKFSVNFLNKNKYRYGGTSINTTDKCTPTHVIVPKDRPNQSSEVSVLSSI